MQFLSLQEEEDLLLWCRIRQLLIDSCAGFKNTQRDIVFTYMLLAQFVLSIILVSDHYDSFLANGDQHQPITVFDLWALVDCTFFFVVLVSIMYLKLALYDLRRTDVKLLHHEFYRASLQNREGLASNPNRDVPTSNGHHASFFEHRPPSTAHSENSIVMRRSISDSSASARLSDVQILLEQTARYIQQHNRPPTVLGYPVTWDVLRYMSLSLVAAIITGLKGTIFTSVFSRR
mmetsp:Transcript_20546/g.32132  ORF Transcript_20546/g.32132 Transcript_20546/m.32132 type:complete len:233 (+) Transcript_20546:118-816(+)